MSHFRNANRNKNSKRVEMPDMVWFVTEVCGSLTVATVVASFVFIVFNEISIGTITPKDGSFNLAVMASLGWIVTNIMVIGTALEIWRKWHKKERRADWQFHLSYVISLLACAL